MTAKPDLPVIPFESREAWEAWLEKHHATSGGLWVKFAKKNSGIESNRYAILYRIQDAKKPETRARRIEKCVAMLSEHKTIYP